MTLLVTGGKGQVGRAIGEAAPTAVCLGKTELDVTNRVQVLDVLASRGATAVINAAAYTNVDGAETAMETAFHVNGKGAANVAWACRQRQIPLVHVSTDYVFDGHHALCLPNDPADPVSVYGTSKLAGEQAIRTIGPQHAIVRSSWIFSHQPGNFVTTMFRLALEQEQLTVVSDQIGCPTSAADLATALLAVVDRLLEGGESGTWHYRGSPIASWHDLATSAVAALARMRPVKAREVVAITTDQWPTAAARPARSVLDCTSFVADFGVVEADWRPALDAAARRWVR